MSKYYDKFSLKLQGMQVLLAKPGGCICGEVGSEKGTYMYMYMYVCHINKVSLLASCHFHTPLPLPHSLAPPPPPPSPAGEDWLAACNASTSSSLHIMEPTGFEIFLEHMIGTNDPYLPRYSVLVTCNSCVSFHNHSMPTCVHVHIYVFKLVV